MMTMATMVVSLHKTHSEICLKSHIAGAFFFLLFFLSLPLNVCHVFVLIVLVMLMHL